jgi:hypothetical protein
MKTHGGVDDFRLLEAWTLSGRMAQMVYPILFLKILKSTSQIFTAAIFT